MPVLGDQRHELYARHRVAGMQPSKAAQAAGYAPGSSTKHLEENPEIIARIGDLTDERTQQKEAQKQAAIAAARIVGELTGVTRAWVIQKLAENAQMAANDGMFKEANQALELIGKDFGMFNGGSSDDENKPRIPENFDMSALEGLLDSAGTGAEAPAVRDGAFDTDLALNLLGGTIAKPVKNRVDREDRKLTTGSETDAGLMPPPEQWTEVDGSISAEDLMDLALGKKTPADFKPKADDDE